MAALIGILFLSSACLSTIITISTAVAPCPQPYIVRPIFGTLNTLLSCNFSGAGHFVFSYSTYLTNGGYTGVETYSSKASKHGYGATQIDNSVYVVLCHADGSNFIFLADHRSINHLKTF
jgi:hypothetical protein